MPMHSAEQYTVALQGFSAFERGALASFFRLSVQRSPSYVQVWSSSTACSARPATSTA